MPISKTRYIRTPTGIIRYDNNFDDDQVHMLELSIQGIRGEAEDPSDINTEDNYHHDKFIITKKCIGLELAENTADKDKKVATARTLETARNITIGLSTKSFDGSEDLNYSLSSIGAFPAAGGILTGNITRSSFKNGDIAISLNNTNSSVSCAGINLDGINTAITIIKSKIGIELRKFSDYGIRISCDDDGNSAIPISINKSGSNAAIWINNSSSENGILLANSGEIKENGNYAVTGSKVYNYCKNTYLPLTGGDVSGAIRIGSSLVSNSNEQLLIGNNLTANHDWQKLIIGKYNNPIVGDIFEIGWGTSDDNRSNILRVAYDGWIHLGNTDYNSYITPYSMQLTENTYGRVSGVNIDGRDYGYLEITPSKIEMNDKSFSSLWSLSCNEFETKYVNNNHFRIKINGANDLCLLDIDSNRIFIGDCDGDNTINGKVILRNSDLIFDKYDCGEVIIERSSSGLDIRSSYVNNMCVSIEDGDLYVSGNILFGNYNGIITSESKKVNCSTAYSSTGNATIGTGSTKIGSTYYSNSSYPNGYPIYLINPVHAISGLQVYGTTIITGGDGAFTTIYNEIVEITNNSSTYGDQYALKVVNDKTGPGLYVSAGTKSDGTKNTALDISGGVTINGDTYMTGHITGNSGGSFYPDGNVFINCHGYSNWLSNILATIDAALVEHDTRLRNGGL